MAKIMVELLHDQNSFTYRRILKVGIIDESLQRVSLPREGNGTYFVCLYTKEKRPLGLLM